MKRLLALPLLLLAACAATAPEASETAFARALLARAKSESPGAAAPAPEPGPPVALPPAATDREVFRGLLTPERVARLRPVAADDEALLALLGAPVDNRDLAVLAILRSPAVARARAGLAAARTSYSQSRDLGDLVAIHRSFVRETSTAVGPDRSRAATAMVTTHPGVTALSGEIAERAVGIAFEDLRAAVRDAAAGALRLHADVVRFGEARRILAEELELNESLLRVLRSRLESGEAGQSGVLLFTSRVEALRTDLANLEAEAPVHRARVGALLHRPGSAPLSLDFDAPAPGSGAGDAGAHLTAARRERPELRRAVLAVERADLAVRLAETMTLPRMDLGATRFERERGPERFPEPGRAMVREDFGVREAQVVEMRARRDALTAARDAEQDRTEVLVREAHLALASALRRTRLHDEQTVPLAERAFAAARGAYEGNRTGYLDLLEAARHELEARLARADANRDVTHARARLLTAVGVEPEVMR